MERCDIIVIGAGVLGLAIARALSLVGREVIVIDKANAIGTETSSRHSEIIHAGIYYPKNSLKAKLCLKGKRAIYKYCEDRGVEFKKLGKIVVATKKEQISELEDIKKNAELNGVMDLSWLTAAEVNSLEPSVSCVKALWSPSTGILDSHAFMLALLGDAENLGATLALLTPVTGGEVLSSGIRIDCGGDDPMSLRANGVINCGGLWSQNIAKKIIGLDKKHIPETYYCKGNYYILSGKSPFTRPIYPVPEKGGLGVHVTVDMAGQARFGPDVEWVESINYDVDPDRSDKFYEAVRKYYPELSDGDIYPGYSGIRPKIRGSAYPASDFLIQGPGQHNINGLVNLFGIESPGMTASLAIAEYVKEMILGYK